VFEIEADHFHLPLRNTLVADEDDGVVRARPL
jgi:hypothetical protein